MASKIRIFGQTSFFISIVLLPACALSEKPSDLEHLELTEEQVVRTAAGIDTDQDGVSNLDDVCAAIFDPSQADQDGDGVGDACDECPDDPAKGYITGCLEKVNFL